MLPHTQVRPPGRKAAKDAAAGARDQREGAREVRGREAAESAKKHTCERL